MRPALKLDPERRFKTGSPDSGFTLLEVMVALSIIAIVLVAVYKMQSQTIGMTASEKFYAAAPFMAQSQIARIMATGLGNTESDTGDFGADFPGYTWEVSIEDTQSEELGTESGKLKKIDVTILFNAGEYKYTLRTYCYMNDEG